MLHRGGTAPIVTPHGWRYTSSKLLIQANAVPLRSGVGVIHRLLRVLDCVCLWTGGDAGTFMSDASLMDGPVGGLFLSATVGDHSKGLR